jgi:hypothetical protein
MHRSGQRVRGLQYAGVAQSNHFFHGYIYESQLIDAIMTPMRATAISAVKKSHCGDSVMEPLLHRNVLVATCFGYWRS